MKHDGCFRYAVVYQLAMEVPQEALRLRSSHASIVHYYSTHDFNTSASFGM